MSAGGAFAVGLVTGSVLLGATAIVYLRFRKPQLREAIGSKALQVITTELVNVARQPGVGSIVQVLALIPDVERVKRELAYEVLADGVLEGVGL